MDTDMDIMEIIDMMEESIEKASVVPLTGKIMIDNVLYHEIRFFSRGFI